MLSYDTYNPASISLFVVPTFSMYRLLLIHFAMARSQAGAMPSIVLATLNGHSPFSFLLVVLILKRFSTFTRCITRDGKTRSLKIADLSLTPESVCLK